jgi:phospholipase C
VDARNEGRYDKWLLAKPSGHRDYAKMPLTLGHYTREDIPFYYAFADAFTVCDQHFCSSLTGTTPNRLYLWTGTVRETSDGSGFAAVRNEEVDYGREAKWKTFPERLEERGISWRIYQNEISLDSGLRGEEDAWLANFTDNPIEWFSQYNVRFAKGHRGHLARLAETLPGEIEALEMGPKTPETEKSLGEKRERLKQMQEARERWSEANWQRLSSFDRSIHEKAFCTNEGDPHYRELTTLTYRDGNEERTVQVPKGDVLHQFREDVKNGKLPTVSWLVAPENFSDHPGAAWYGAWYVSEVLDILTQNPEVWKKTILILTYDENDGYFDHVPPFVAPHPRKPETGFVSKGIDTSVEYVELEQDLKRKPAREARGSAIGLGYRVPMVVASPWSRGGCVNSQVFDHTSVLQFLETFLSHKTGKRIEETNISRWRRTVCGDLTSIFQPYRGERTTVPPFPSRDEFIESIHRARFKKLPNGYRAFSEAELAAIRKAPETASYMVPQEPGTRRSCPLPYELVVDGGLNADGSAVEFRMEARNAAFGKRALGSPFNAYAYVGDDVKTRSYAVAAGDALVDAWPLAAFEGGKYHVRVDGPNGFCREFRGAAGEPKVQVMVGYARGRDRKPNGKLEVRLVNGDDQARTVVVRDRAYGAGRVRKTVPARGKATVVVSTEGSRGWYDLSVRIEGADAYERMYAGRVETGQWSISDPAMGRRPK